MSDDVLRIVFEATAAENERFPGVLAKPFVVGKWVYASDGALAIRAPAAIAGGLGLALCDRTTQAHERASKFPWRLTRQTRAEWPSLPSIPTPEEEDGWEGPAPYVTAFGRKFDPGYVAGLALVGAVPCWPAPLEQEEWPHKPLLLTPLGFVGSGFEALLMPVRTKADNAWKSMGREFYRRLESLAHRTATGGVR